MDIKFRVIGQKLTMLTKYNKFVSDAMDFMYLIFDLPREWSGYAVSAEFVQNGKTISKPLDTKKGVYLPSDLTEGMCLLALYGAKSGSTVTTDSVALYIDKFVGSGRSGDSYVIVELAKPTITVSDSGLVTAKVSQEEGYVVKSSKEERYQLPTQAGITIRPERDNKVAVEAGKYTTGQIIISGDKNLDPANIRKGATIFDVQGLYEGQVITELPPLDNQAFQEDIVKGKTLYDDQGNPVTGIMKTLGFGAFCDISSVDISIDENGMKTLVVGGNTSNDKRTYVDPESPVVVYAEEASLSTSCFGDAQPQDVAKGVTFTSAAGLLVIGEHECDTGAQLPELNNAAADDEVFLNKEYINASGQKRTGSFSIDSELTEQDSLINQITEALKNKAFSGDSGDSVTINATIDGLTITSYTIPPGHHSGYGTVSLTSDIENALAAI